MRRPWFKRLAVLAAILGTLALLAGVGLLADRDATRRADVSRLNEALTRLDADDPDWHVVGVVKAHNRAIPDDDAANVTKVTLSALGWRPVSWKARQAAISAQEIPDLTWDDDRLPHDDEFCSLYEVHLESGRTHQEAFAARKLPTGGLPFRFGEPDPFGTLLPELQRVRECCGLFADYATVEAYLGRGDEALRAADACLHLAQVSLATEPRLISQLVRNASCSIAVGSAQKTLAWSEPTESLSELQAAFAQAATVDGLSAAFRGERAAIMRVYDNVRRGALPADYLDNGPRRPGSTALGDQFKRRFNAPNRARDQVQVLAGYNDLIAAARLSGPARRAATDAAVSRTVTEGANMLPTSANCIKADDRCKARLLGASVGLACERYRRQFGHFPKTLADVPPAILPAVPTDPFNGRPLGYRVLEDGASVYSVGPDGRHLGTPDETVSVRDSQIFSFRLWNPDARRRPPLPRFDPDAVEPPEPDGVP